MKTKAEEKASKQSEPTRKIQKEKDFANSWFRIPDYLYCRVSRRTRNLRRVYDLGAKRRIQTRTFAYGNRRSRIFRRKRRKIDYKSDNYVNPDSIPEHVKAAFVALEDKRFYSHQGYDVKGIIRAVATNIKAGGTVEGASTITQQLVKTRI